MENKKINYSKENVEKICKLLEKYILENEESVNELRELRRKKILLVELNSELMDHEYIEHPIDLDADEVSIYIILLLKSIYGDTENPYLDIFNKMVSTFRPSRF